MAMEAAQRIATISNRKRKRKQELGHEVCRHLLEMLWDGGNEDVNLDLDAQGPSFLFQQGSRESRQSRSEPAHESIRQHALKRATYRVHLQSRQQEQAQEQTQQLALL